MEGTGGAATGRPRERAPGPRRIEGRPGDWPRPADPARVPRLGVALRAREGAARTAVPAPPPQSAPRSAPHCHRAAPRKPRAQRPAPSGAAAPRHHRRSPPQPPGRGAGTASGPAFETTSAAAARAARGRQAGAAWNWSRPLLR
ncbi:hypothetical protein MC885_004191 [Smutsia gigantea]|nr:hypothetical protein MC885_004191 [Smutsia gigantea]